MATKVINSEKITLHDGSVVEMRSLNIKALREFMKITKDFGAVDDEEKSLDLLVRASLVALNACNEEKYDSVEDVEELLDMNIITKIFQVAAGIDLNSADVPNSIAPAV